MSKMIVKNIMVNVQQNNYQAILLAGHESAKVLLNVKYASGFS